MKKMMTFMVALAFLGFLAMPAVAGVSVDGNVRAEMLLTGTTETKYGGTTTDSDKNAQFQNVKANVNVNGDIADGVKALVELRTGDVVTNVVTMVEKNDIGLVTNVTTVTTTKPSVLVRQAFVKLTNLIPNAVLRVGKLRVPFAGGLQAVDNANNMRNPLIDPAINYSSFLATDAGADCTMNLSDMFSATLGVFNGNSVTNGKFAFVLKGVAKPMEGLEVTGGYYTSDNTPDTSGVVLDNKTSAYEFIGQYKMAALTAKGIYGNNTNDNGTKEPNTSYMGVQGSYDINDMIWVAGRFVKSTHDYDDASKEDLETTEMAIGGGYNLAENTKVKIQYRSVKEEQGSDEMTGSGVNAEIVTAF